MRVLGVAASTMRLGHRERKLEASYQKAVAEGLRFKLYRTSRKMLDVLGLWHRSPIEKMGSCFGGCVGADCWEFFGHSTPNRKHLWEENAGL